ncbi:MAG: hypothetical protein V7K66_18630 [Nostoc sp.]
MTNYLSLYRKPAIASLATSSRILAAIVFRGIGTADDRYTSCN